MTAIRSTWTLLAPPPLTGLLKAAEWSAAATMPVPLGILLAQNDATHLYIGLDLTAETGAASNNDYFQFLVDIHGNGQIDANRDKAFGVIQGALNTLTMVSMLGPNTETGVPPGQAIPSELRSGFGPSLHSAVHHRQWQIAFALSDLGIDPIDPTGPCPVVNFGLMVGTVGGAGYEAPANASASFANLNQIVLSCTPSTPASATATPIKPVAGSAPKECEAVTITSRLGVLPSAGYLAGRRA